MHQVRGAAVAFLTLALMFCAAGCDRRGSAPPGDMPLPADDELRARLDDVLRFTYNNRQLTIADNAAWQILHGVVAFQRELTILDADGQQVRALDYLFDGGAARGWDFEPGRVDAATGRTGVRAIVQPGSNTGQGHPDQWIGYMSQCGLKLDHPLKLNDYHCTLQDYLAQTEWDVPRNLTREFSWTLMALATYRPTDYQWTASDGNVWSTEKLVGIEAEHDLVGSACGGSHRLVGLAMALEAHLKQGGMLAGPWAAADEKIQNAIATIQEYQNSDGSFSVYYFARPGGDVDLKESLGTTGHTLEFLMWVLDDDELRAPWVQRAVVRLCDLFERTEELPLECGALYHAASALVLYRTRAFGPLPPLGETSVAPESPAPPATDANRVPKAKTEPAAGNS